MKIVIAGCGKIGKSILKCLVREGHEIAVLDTDAAVIDGITDAFDVMGINASATSLNALNEAGAGSSELFIAASGNDEVNMLSCFLAGRMGAQHTVARISDSEKSTERLEVIKRELGLSMVINPDLLTAQRINSILKFPSSVKSEVFTRGRFEMAELSVKVGSVLDGAKLFDLRGRLGVPFLVCCVLRDGETYIPKGDFTLRAGDRIGLLAAPDDMNRVLKSIGLLQKCAKDIMILGGSRTAVYLTRELVRRGSRVKLIEKSRERCVELSSLLPYPVNVICGDGTRHTLLSEEGLSRTDAFIALTGMDEENILSSYFAFDLKVPKIITKANQEGFTAVSEKLGLDCLISPHRITADAVTQYARALQNSVGSKIETLYSLMDGSAEALEFAVTAVFEELNIPLKELRLKPEILLAGILRGSRAIIPTGNDIILPNDNVIVIAAGTRLCDLSDILL